MAANHPAPGSRPAAVVDELAESAGGPAAVVATVAIAYATAWLLPAPRMDDRAALGLEAFAADAPHLPSTLLAHR